MIRSNSHSNPADGEFTISLRHNEDDFLVCWKRNETTHGIVVRFGALNPLKSLLAEAGYVQVIEPDVYNDEFQCEKCKQIYDIEDSIKEDGILLCPLCVKH